MAKRSKILICDDQASIRTSLGEALSDEGYQVHEAADGAAAEALLEEGEFDLALLDLKLPDTTGVEILRQMRARGLDIPTILMTAYGDTPTAVEAMQLGAWDFVQKPYSLAEMKEKVASALKAQKRQAWAESQRTGGSFKGGQYFDMLRQTPGLAHIAATVEQIGRSRAGNLASVLITGESGCGKEIVSRAIHEAGQSGAPFMEINCAAVPDTLLESELFGHEKGAFTDARATKEGLFELAGQGTIFLDEIGEMGVTLQSRLLRVIENRSLRRVGGKSDRELRARIVAATNRELQQAIKDGLFRNDLYFRLQVIEIHVPSLRERPEDVPHLARSFVEAFNHELGLECKPPSDELCELLLQYPWPGNVRELKNLMRRVMILEDPLEILPHHLPPHVVRGENPRADEQDPEIDRVGRTMMPLSEAERIHIQYVLEACQGNKSKAARILKISRQTLREKLKSYDREAAEGSELKEMAAGE
ncbi:sigma-54-dependent Fis family transcriptional regulator [bacterium]|nr:MAG: sigma-54-dependent Fis family transcriptional regulator [bacterium]